MSFFPYYENLTNKRELKLIKEIQQCGHSVDLLNILSESFVHNFEKLEKLPTGIIEQYLNTYGVCGVCEDENGKIVIGIADLMSTSYYNYQKGDNVNITMIGSNRVFNKKVGIDCELIFNNSTRTPTIDVMTFSSLLTEIDVSLDKIIKMTRYIKVPIVNNQKEKDQIEEIFSAIERGDLKAVTSMKNDIEKLMSAYTDSSDNNIKTIELTDVEKSNNIQYLTLLRNSLKEFFYTKYGHSIRNTAKVAQQSKDEVNDLSVTSLILPFNMLKNRKQGWERVNALFGTNYTCEFSDLINIELMRTEETEEPKEPETEENNNESDA
jgi:hypothetical protein